MGISEVNSKGGCLRLAVKHLKQLQDNTMEALAWLERSDAFVPDESKAVQELKDALAKSTERETELERRLAASFARELRLTSYIGGLAKMAAEAESILEDVRNIGRILPDVGSNAEAWGQTLDNSSEACCQNFEECDKQCVPLANYWRNLAKGVEKSKTDEPQGDTKIPCWYEPEQSIQFAPWHIPDVTCNMEPVESKPAEQPTGAKFPPWYNANSEFKA